MHSESNIRVGVASTLFTVFLTLLGTSLYNEGLNLFGKKAAIEASIKYGPSNFPTQEMMETMGYKRSETDTETRRTNDTLDSIFVDKIYKNNHYAKIELVNNGGSTAEKVTLTIPFDAVLAVSSGSSSDPMIIRVDAPEERTIILGSIIPTNTLSIEAWFKYERFNFSSFSEVDLSGITISSEGKYFPLKIFGYGTVGALIDGHVGTSVMVATIILGLLLGITLVFLMAKVVFTTMFPKLAHKLNDEFQIDEELRKLAKERVLKKRETENQMEG